MPIFVSSFLIKSKAIKTFHRRRGPASFDSRGKWTQSLIAWDNPRRGYQRPPVCLIATVHQEPRHNIPNTVASGSRSAFLRAYPLPAGNGIRSTDGILPPVIRYCIDYFPAFTVGIGFALG